jgi:uncharacterized protein (TIGR03435 family)
MRELIANNPTLHRFRVALLITVAVATAVAGGAALQAQAAQQPAPERVAFAAAALKLAGPGARGVRGLTQDMGAPCGFIGIQVEAKRLAITAYPYTLIQMAYGQKGSNCRVPELLTGGPEWMRADLYNLQADLPEGTPTYTPRQLAQRDAPQLQLMLRTLLEESFKLKMHTQKTEVPAYVLSAGKGTPKLRPAPANAPTTRSINRLKDGVVGGEYGRFVAGNATIAEMANLLAQLLRVPEIVDKTGIEGQFNFAFDFDMNGAIRPSIPSALQQLGLKLEDIKVSKDAIVIDAIERPTP